MLVQIASTDILRPFHFALIRHQFTGDNIHKGRFSLAVGTDETDMFPFNRRNDTSLKIARSPNPWVRCSTFNMLIFPHILLLCSVVSINSPLQV